MKKIWLLALLLPLTVSASSFVDVDTANEHFQAIEWLHRTGVVEGYREGTHRFFKSDQPVNRAEAIKMLLLTTGRLTENAEPGGYFDDVRSNHWFAPFVASAAEQGIVEGFADGNFYPASRVTRAELLKMTLTTLEFPITESDGTNWYDPFLATGVEWRLITADDKPHEALARGEVAEILYRAQSVSEKKFTAPYAVTGSGSASWYGPGFEGKPTANGEPYDPEDLTAAHRTLSFGTRIKVWLHNHPENWVIVRINDRGPYIGDRVLDLSRRAFAELAPTSRGLIEIEYELYTAPDDPTPAVPEYIRPALSDKIRTVPIPEPVADAVEKKLLPATPLWDEGDILHLPKDFFEHFTLRRPLSTRQPIGTILNLSGWIDEWGHKSVTVFLTKIPDAVGVENTQQHFSAKLSGKNFSLAVPLWAEGRYQLGMVIDDERRSRVGEIEVVPSPRERRFPAQKQNTTESNFELRLVPDTENSRVIFQHVDPRMLRKIEWEQGSVRRELLLEAGLDTLDVPFAWFEKFSSDIPLQVTAWLADSTDGMIAGRAANWQPIGSKKFTLLPGFPDTESDDISVHDFSRYHHSLATQHLTGERLTRDVTIANTAFWRTPDGRVRKIPVKITGDLFELNVRPEDWGAHVLEIVGTDGEMLFNRGMYFWPNEILPVRTWPTPPFVGTDSTAVRSWTNQLRATQNISALRVNLDLNSFAQQYAEQMSADNFIGHTSPTGLTFQQRIERASLRAGEYGENLGFGTTLALAVEGLSHSGSHRHNLLQNKWHKIGIGIAQGKNGWYVVQTFGQ